MANLFGVSNDGAPPDAYNYEMVRQALTMRAGQGIACELLADNEVDECLEAARREINRMAPLWYWGSFTTTAGQQRYPAAAVLPNNYLGTCKVFYSGGAAAGGCANFVLFPRFGNQWDVLFSGAMSGMVGSTVEYERIQAVIKAYSRLRKIFSPRGWLERDGSIWLDPVPGAALPVYFMAQVPRFQRIVGDGGVDEVWAESLFDFAGARACEILAAKQSEVAQVDDGGGKSARSAAGAVYLKLADKLEARFYAKVAAGPTARVMSGISGF